VAAELENATEPSVDPSEHMQVVVLVVWYFLGHSCGFGNVH
jgi:hypothetical protein